MNEGQTAANTGTYSDPNSGDNVTITASVGTVTKTGTNSGAWSWSFGTTDGPNQSQTVTITANDGNGGTATTTFALTVNNVAPTIALTGNAAVNEGSLYTLNLGAITDPGQDTVTAYSINWGDGTIENFSGNPTGQSKTHTYTDDNPTATPSDNYTITVSLTDEDGTFPNAGTKVITVNNVAPTITSITGPTGPVALAGNNPSVTANYTDPGTGDTHTCTFSWDDGSSNTTVAGSGSGTGSCTASHTYAAAGVYKVTVTVTDDDTGSATGFFEFIVIFDANAGFITGGGRVNSPAGALVGSPASGTANLGFNAKYKNDGSLDGQNNFNFATGNFHFHGEVHNYLVITPNNRAQYQATGRVNGVYGYKATVTAWDNSTTPGCTGDRYRMRIKDSANVVVYDNGTGNDDVDTCPPPTIQGNIVVHSGALSGPGGGQGVVPLLTFEQLQPLVAAAVARWQAAGISPVQLEVLRQTPVRLVSLAGGNVGWTTAGAILIDPDAAGHGWFLDPTPHDDFEFGLANSTAQGRLDLLSVVVHEMWHVLGLEHSHGDDVMGETLLLGVRRLPRAADLSDPRLLEVAATAAKSAPVAEGSVALRLLDTTGNAAPAVADTVSSPLSSPAVTPSAGDLFVGPVTAAVREVQEIGSAQRQLLDHIFAEVLDAVLVDDLGRGFGR